MAPAGRSAPVIARPGPCLISRTISAPERRQARLAPVQRRDLLLERMIDKGALTFSIDKALWAAAGIIVAVKVPPALAGALQLARHVP